MNEVTEPAHYQQLRAWAKGLHPSEAAVELLIRTGWAHQDRPWVIAYDDVEGHWIDFDAICDHLAGLSGGQRRLLLLAAAIGSDTVAVNLHDTLCGLDRGTLDLVLAAVAHAGGSHQGTSLTYSDDLPVFTPVTRALYPWPTGPESAAITRRRPPTTETERGDRAQAVRPARHSTRMDSDHSGPDARTDQDAGVRGEPTIDPVIEPTKTRPGTGRPSTDIGGMPR